MGGLGEDFPGGDPVQLQVKYIAGVVGYVAPHAAGFGEHHRPEDPGAFVGDTVIADGEGAAEVVPVVGRQADLLRQLGGFPPGGAGGAGGGGPAFDLADGAADGAG